MRWDCLIMGKGPAGISAALYLQRAGLSTLAMGKDLGALEKAENIQNYYGFPGGISGKELAERGIQQAQSWALWSVQKKSFPLNKNQKVF